MTAMYRSVGDVEARVATDPVRLNGKAMLQVELAMGMYGDGSRVFIEQWLAQDDEREALKQRAERDAWERSIKLRTTEATELQAAQSVKATRIALAALVIAALSFILALAALLRGT